MYASVTLNTNLHYWHFLTLDSRQLDFGLLTLTWTPLCTLDSTLNFKLWTPFWTLHFKNYRQANTLPQHWLYRSSHMPASFFDKAAGQFAICHFIKKRGQQPATLGVFRSLAVFLKYMQFIQNRHCTKNEVFH